MPEAAPVWYSGGGQGGASGATLDGISVNTNRQASGTETAFLTPSVEAITEFAVDTGGFKAEYGQAGGGAISFASKSGTNTVHGSAYDFIRNDDLDARGFFAASPGVYKQNDYGVSFGGPCLDFRSFITAKTEPSSSSPMRASRTESAPTESFRASPTPQMYQGDFLAVGE